MKTIKDFDFIATMLENKVNLQKSIGVPHKKKDNYLTGRKYKVILVLISENEEIDTPSFPLEQLEE